MSDAWIQSFSNRYIELYEKIIGEKFVPVKLSDEETERLVNEELEKLI